MCVHSIASWKAAESRRTPGRQCALSSSLDRVCPSMFLASTDLHDRCNRSRGTEALRASCNRYILCFGTSVFKHPLCRSRSGAQLASHASVPAFEFLNSRTCRGSRGGAMGTFSRPALATRAVPTSLTGSSICEPSRFEDSSTQA